MTFWIVRYWHRFGDDAWPVWKKTRPDLKWLLKTDPDFARDYEGEGSIERHEDEWREDEGVEIYGPFTVPNLCKECAALKNSP
jgi:hypothetical protein